MTPTLTALHLEAQVTTPRLATIAHHCRRFGVEPATFYLSLAARLPLASALHLLNEGTEEQVEEAVAAAITAP